MHTWTEHLPAAAVCTQTKHLQVLFRLSKAAIQHSASLWTTLLAFFQMIVKWSQQRCGQKYIDTPVHVTFSWGQFWSPLPLRFSGLWNNFTNVALWEISHRSVLNQVQMFKPWRLSNHAGTLLSSSFFCFTSSFGSEVTMNLLNQSFSTCEHHHHQLCWSLVVEANCDKTENRVVRNIWVYSQAGGGHFVLDVMAI